VFKENGVNIFKGFTNMEKENRLLALARLFLKLGIIGFGGPVVHIAMMEEEVVRKKNGLRSSIFWIW
jgi:chromate transporter